jgi:hypothetical protein
MITAGETKCERGGGPSLGYGGGGALHAGGWGQREPLHVGDTSAWAAAAQCQCQRASQEQQ